MKISNGQIMMALSEMSNTLLAFSELEKIKMEMREAENKLAYAQFKNMRLFFRLIIKLVIMAALLQMILLVLLLI